MRRWLPSFILILLALVAAFPLWASSQFPLTYDSLLHLYRLYAHDLTVRQGILYPRWIPQLALGYGYPLFNYYPPLASYTAETLHLFGLGFAEAIKATLFIAILIALFGAYALGRELFRGEHSEIAVGLLTAVAFVFFPYFLYDLYQRGAMAEALALGLLPWLVWSLHRVLRQPNLSAFLLTALFFALLALAHSLTAAVIAPLLIAYVIFEAIRLPSSQRIRSLLFAAASALLGAALTAFYTLPYLLELPAVRMGRGMDKIQEIFESSFQSLSVIIQPALLYRYGETPLAPLGLFVVLLALVVLGLAFLARKQLREPATIFFFGAVALIGIASMTEPVRDLWLALPFSSLIQSVWRVSIAINLSLAIVIGSFPYVLSSLSSIQQFDFNLQVRYNKKWTNVPLFAAAATGLLLILTAMAKIPTDAVYLPSGDFTVGRLARFEAVTQNLGTTTFSEYLPAPVAIQNPNTFSAVPSPIRNENAIDVRVERAIGTEWALQTDAPKPTTLILRAFNFPGWQAKIDGATVPIRGATDLDLLSVQLPAGQHQATITLNQTPAQNTGLLLSALAALFVLIGLAVALLRRERNAWMPLAVTGIAVLVFGTPTLAALTAAPPASQSVASRVAPGVDLIGWGIDDAQMQNGAWVVDKPAAQLPLRLYWHAKQSAPPDTPVTLQLVDDAGQVRAQRIQFPRYSTALQHTWVENELIEDHYDLPLVSVPRGNYTLQLAYGADQPVIPVGRIEFAQDSPAPPPAPQIAHPLDARLGDKIRLLGYDAPDRVQAGSTLTPTLYWQTNADVTDDYVVSTQLLNSEGKLVAQVDEPPAQGLSPTSLWVPGETVADRHILQLPPDLPPGNYTLIAVMYSLPDLQRLPVMQNGAPVAGDYVTLGVVKVTE